MSSRSSLTICCFQHRSGREAIGLGFDLGLNWWRIPLCVEGLVEPESISFACNLVSKYPTGMYNLAYSMPWEGFGASKNAGRGGDDGIKYSSGVLPGVGDWTSICAKYGCLWGRG